MGISLLILLVLKILVLNKQAKPAAVVMSVVKITTFCFILAQFRRCREHAQNPYIQFFFVCNSHVTINTCTDECVTETTHLIR